MLQQLLGGDPALTPKGHAYAHQLPAIIVPLLPKVGWAGTAAKHLNRVLTTYRGSCDSTGLPES